MGEAEVRRGSRRPTGAPPERSIRDADSAPAEPLTFTSPDLPSRRSSRNKEAEDAGSAHHLRGCRGPRASGAILPWDGDDALDAACPLSPRVDEHRGVVGAREDADLPEPG